MAAITQVISPVSPLAPPPNPSIPSTFDALAYTFSTSLKTVGDQISTNLVGEINTFKDQANSLRLEVNDSRDVTIASALAAANSATLAQNAANYKGDWVAGYNTTGYTMGMSVSFTDGQKYVSKINNNLISPITLTNTPEWDYLEAVSPAELALKLDKAGGTLTGALNIARATVASHATTANIWGALGNQIDFTGTATVTAFPNAPQAGATRELICAGACSFTAGANMIIDGVPSGTVTCASGDTVIVRAISTTQFKLTRLKADGTPQVSVAGGSMIFLSEIVASGAATVDIENTFSSTYDKYIIEVNGMKQSTDSGEIFMRMKVGGIYSTALTYMYQGEITDTQQAAGIYQSNVNAGFDCIKLLIGLGSQTFESANMSITVDNPSSTTLYKSVYWHGITMKQGSSTMRLARSAGVGAIRDTQVLTGIRIYPPSGTISGTFRLYGIKKS